MIIPGVRKPHWKPCAARNACWSGWRPPGPPSPSMVALAAESAHRRVEAAVHRDAVHVHGAGAAVAGAAALLHAEPPLLAQERAQAPAGARPAGGGDAVDIHAASSATTSATLRRVIAARHTALPL
jgi:hypothetical protein